MEVFLYNSTVCRLCGEENDNGSLLYTNDENNQNLSDIINSYLPIKVSDDGQLPRTICPGCTIQLEATVEFFNLIINGQKVIRELHQRENEYKKNVLNVTESDVIAEKIVYEINTSDGVYHVEHPISLQVAGLDKPKRKRGRPSKKPKSPEELALEAAAAAAAKEQEAKCQAEIKLQDESSGKRRRKTPTRYKEAVQGKELEKIFLEEGVIDKEENDAEKKSDGEAKSKAVPTEPEIIGHVETSGEPVIVVKGKGRGRPKGTTRSNKSQCATCGMEFWSLGRYMSHVAAHHTAHAPQSQQIPTPEESNSQSDDTIVTIDVETEQLEISKEEVPAHCPPTDDGAIDTKDVNVDGDCGNKPEEASADENEEETLVNASGKSKLKCKHCDKLFSTKQSKSLHIKAVHLGERPYVCGECGAAFPYPRSLALHALAHRRRRARRGYACDLCGKILNHPSSVVYHKQAVHAAQRYVCGACGKHFRHTQLLQRHQLVHSADRPFRCKQCDASFKTKANLCNHQLLHSGVKRFACEICRHRFSHKTSLTLHMRWHTGVKPYECAWCGKSFSQKGNLSEHERIHTGERPFACARCPRRFTTSSQHRLHAARHHPNRSASLAEESQESTLSGVEALVHDDVIAPKTHKQVSLLVHEQPPPAVEVTLTPDQLRQLCPAPSPPNSAPPGAEGDAGADGDEVIYVAYDVDSADTTAFQIIDSQQAEAVRGRTPLQFRMQDGSLLAVTSLDGETLQIVTQDGQTIPVEVNTFDGDVVETVTSGDSMDSVTLVEESRASDPQPLSPPAHYFTIV